jgi:hypothetical protein
MRGGYGEPRYANRDYDGEQRMSHGGGRGGRPPYFENYEERRPFRDYNQHGEGGANNRGTPYGGSDDRDQSDRDPYIVQGSGAYRGGRGGPERGGYGMRARGGGRGDMMRGRGRGGEVPMRGGRGRGEFRMRGGDPDRED